MARRADATIGARRAGDRSRSADADVRRTPAQPGLRQRAGGAGGNGRRVRPERRDRAIRSVRDESSTTAWRSSRPDSRGGRGDVSPPRATSFRARSRRISISRARSRQAGVRRGGRGDRRSRWRCRPNEPVVYFDAARAARRRETVRRGSIESPRGDVSSPRSFYGALAEGLVAQSRGATRLAPSARFSEAVTHEPGAGRRALRARMLAESRGDRAAAEAEYRRALDGDPRRWPGPARLARVTRQGK